MKTRRNENCNLNEKGNSVVEVLVAGMILSAIIVFGMFILSGSTQTIEETSALTDAQLAAEGALSALSSKVQTSERGSFTDVSDGVLTLTDCTPQTCDYVLQNDADISEKTSPAKGVPYGTALSTDNPMTYLRRWKVETVNGDYNVKMITVAVVEDTEDTKPVVILQTRVFTK